MAQGNGFLQPCEVCVGQGTTRGVFFDLDCTCCDGIGWLDGDQPATAQQVGRLLSVALQRTGLLEQALIRRGHVLGPERDYQDHPRDGVGGHRTGD